MFENQEVNVFDKIINWGLFALVFLLPLFFLPLTTDFYEFNKNILLYCFTALLMIVWGLEMVREKKVVFVRTPFDLPILAIAAAFTLSTLVASTNKWEALWIPGGTGTILASTILYFLITNHLRKGHLQKGIVTALIASASLLSLVAIYQFIGIGEAFVPAKTGLDWLRAKTFTPSGNPLILASFLGVCLTLALTWIYTDWKNDRGQGSPVLLFYYLAALLMLAGLGVTSYQLFTAARPILLPQTAGWVIAIEAFKRFPFWGVGPENFISAFTTAKPIGLNSSEFWALRFGISSNLYFQLLTTTGIFGLGAFLWLVLKIINGVKDLNEERTTLSSAENPSTEGLSAENPSADGLFKEKLGLYPGILLSLLIFVFLPANLLLLTTCYLLLSLLGANLTKAVIKEESKTLAGVILFVALLVAGASLYGVSRVFAAELFFQQSLSAAAQNKGMDTYNLQIKMIQTNPYYDLYRIAYSQTNLALANAIAGKDPSAGGLTDQDRQNISSLIQQAVREAKAAIALGPNKAQNWENLASLYRNLINFASGADQWTIESFNQAIFLDPVNPILRLNLGGVYFALKNYDAAIRQFITAVNLKPDFANGHYNLATAYREKGMIKEAVGEMEQTQALVQPGTNDYQKASQELEDLRAKLPQEETASPQAGELETLTPPASPPAGLKPPLNLPKEVQPQVGTPSGR